MPLFRIWIALGALNGLLAVGAAAFVAHAPFDPSRLRALSSGVQMQGWHALAVIACGLLAAQQGGGSWGVHAAAILFLVGVLLFAAAVWVPQFGGPSLGMVAPVGGTLTMIGWVVLAIAALVGAG